MRGQSHRIGDKPRERPSTPVEEPYFGEPGPIVIPRKGIGRAEPVGFLADEEVDRIALPGRAEPLAPAAVEPASGARTTSRGRWTALIGGLAAGALAGAIVGGVVAVNVRPARQPPADSSTAPGAVRNPALAQSMIAPALPAPDAAPLTAPIPPATQPPSMPPEAKVEAEPSAPPALDLDRLAKALAAANGAAPKAAAPPAAPAAPPTQPPPTAQAAASPPPAEPARPVVIEPPRVVEAPKIAPPAAVTAPPPRPKLATQRPSFDCSGAASPTQQLICSDPVLAQADRQLALAYDAAMASAKDRKALHDDQQRWLADRDRLGADRAAVAAFYQSRLTELGAQTREDRRKGGLLRRAIGKLG